MFCTACGNQILSEQRFCTKCGSPTHQIITGVETGANRIRHLLSRPRFKSTLARGIIIGVIVVAVGLYISQDNDSVEKNNAAISDFNSGDSDSAILQFHQASQNAVSDETRIGTLKNLGYVYTTEGEYEQALNAFRQALEFTDVESFDYFLISGEIALLEGKPNSAFLSFTRAYNLDPEDFQVNNSLALFHLDLEEVALEYEDYEKALAYAKKAYALNSSEIARQNLGIAHFFNGNFTITIELLSQSNSLQHPYVNLWIGLAYAALDDVPNARFYLQQAVQANVGVPQEVYDYLVATE